MPNSKVSQRDLYETINEFRQEVNERFDHFEGSFVSHEEFSPVKKCVYGIVALALGGVGTALIRLVVYATNGK